MELTQSSRGQKFWVPSITNPDSAVFNGFFAPVIDYFARFETRKCPALEDKDWTIGGVTRVVQCVKSGRDFLQSIAVQLDGDLSLSLYFESLKSQRRLGMLRDVNKHVAAAMRTALPDRFSGIEELEGFEVFAGDGHWHKHATHDPSKPRKSGDGTTQTKFATGHLYGIDLRRRSLFHLTACDEVNKRKEHDMGALQRLDASLLRQGAPKGKKVLWVWDRAGIDLRQWYRWKLSKGVYFLSRAKENMNLESAPRPWDQDDPVNRGVQKDGLLVETSCGVQTRCIEYRDPLTGDAFNFITNEMTLSPGMHVQLYRMRWDAEKAFDDFKNKFDEKKAWATSECAKTIQAQFLCLAHNLTTLYEYQLAEQEGLTNDAEDQRRRKRLGEQKKVAASKGEELPDLYLRLSRATQFALKFIRWLRIYLFSSSSWEEAESHLRRCYAKL